MAKQQTDPPKLKDGFTNALGGVNSDIEPIELVPNELAFAVNVRLRGGFPKSRPGMAKRPFKFQNTEAAVWFGTKLFQGATTYVNASMTDENSQVVSVGGRLFLVNVATDYGVSEITPTQHTQLSADQVSPPSGGQVQWQVVDATKILIGLPIKIGDGHYQVTNKLNNLLFLTNLDATPGLAVPAGTPVIYLDPNPSIWPTVWFAQFDKYLIVQDSQSAPIIFDGSSPRRATTTEIPIGTVMTFHRQRLWVAVGTNRNLFVAGDIVSPDHPENGLNFTEYLMDGVGAFVLDEPITAMSELPILDQSLGQGPLQVITKNSFNSVDLPTQRDTWKTIANPFLTVSLENSGALSQFGVQVVNSDIWYVAADGLRSFQVARREQGQWTHTPMSAEMSRVADNQEPSLLKFSSAILFDQRLLYTVTPHRITLGGAFFDGIISLDFNPMGSVKRKQAPIFDGLWTGIHPYQLLTTEIDDKTRCYAYTNEPTGIGLWEISKDDDFDGDGGRISSWIEYPSFTFKTPMIRKKLQSFKSWVAHLVGTVDFTLRFRPDDAQCWIFWGKRTKCATGSSCAKADTCYTLQTFKAGYKPHMGFGLPRDDVCDEFNGSNARFAYSWQMRFEWVGQAKIMRCISTADEFDLQPLGEEDSDE